MKKLIRRLSRVSDSSEYCLLRSERQHSTRSKKSLSITRYRRSSGVPEGCIPVYVGDEMERFVVNAQLLNHPIFIRLLNKSAQEYGYEQKGVLHIPCHVLVFERVLEALRIGQQSRDLQSLVGSIADEFQ